MLGVCDKGAETDLGELSLHSVCLALNDVTSNQQAFPQLPLGSQNCAGHQGTPDVKNSLTLRALTLSLVEGYMCT